MRNLNDLLKDWNKATDGIGKLQKQIPAIVGTIAVAEVRKNFKAEAYKGVPWKARAAKTNKAYSSGRGTGENGRFKGTTFNADAPLLRQTSSLYNSIKKQVRYPTVTVGVDLDIIPYAQIQNEGGNGIPARQYIPRPDEGPTESMIISVEQKLDKEIKREMSKFVP